MRPRVSCASRIKEGMKMRGMKQVDLRDKTGIPKSTMSAYVNGGFEPKQDAVELLARALNVGEAWLMGYDVPPDREKSVSYISNDERELAEIIDFLTTNKEAKALTAAIREMTEEEIRELTKYGEYLRLRDGIK